MKGVEGEAFTEMDVCGCCKLAGGDRAEAGLDEFGSEIVASGMEDTGDIAKRKFIWM